VRASQKLRTFVLESWVVQPLAGNTPAMEYLIVFGVVAMMTVCVLIIARCLQPA
jgi:hypothetical protein